ncbi:MAG: guanylate kinase [Cyclobacteriaceae bacterium]|nr:guanylate kinase [Cyclobacteriaceae bacterium]
MLEVNKGKAIIFSAPSGSGKSTLVHKLLAKYPQLEFSISATTRNPRGTERQGIDYHFFSVEQFHKLISNNELVEYEEVYAGRFYGTLKSELKRIWEKGHIVVFDVDVVGGVNLKNYFGDSAISFFIKAPSIEILQLRLEMRGTDSREEIKKRVGKASYEMTFQDKFDHVIINDNLDVAIQSIEEILIPIFNTNK